MGQVCLYNYPSVCYIFKTTDIGTRGWRPLVNRRIIIQTYLTPRDRQLSLYTTSASFFKKRAPYERKQLFYPIKRISGIVYSRQCGWSVATYGRSARHPWSRTQTQIPNSCGWIISPLRGKFLSRSGDVIHPQLLGIWAWVRDYATPMYFVVT